MSNLLKQHKQILYRLKRNFGQSAIFHIPTENEYNITTGQTTRSYTDLTVRRVIVLPQDMKRLFAYDLAFIASNKNFTYGGFYDKFTRNMIIDKKDLKGNELELNWECTFKNKRYIIKSFTETENSAGYLISWSDLDKPEGE